MKLCFREAVEEDLPAIVALLVDDALGATRESDDMSIYRAAFARMKGSGANTVIVAIHDDEIVGTYQYISIEGLSLTATKRAQVESVRIRSDHRGKGLGTQLMTDAIHRAKADGCGLVQLTTNQARSSTHRFYDHLGFVQSHYGYKLML